MGHTKIKYLFGSFPRRSIPHRSEKLGMLHEFACHPCAGDRPKLSVEMIVELSLFRQCYVRRVVFSAFDWFVSRIEIPFQVVRSGFSRVFATFIHSEQYTTFEVSSCFGRVLCIVRGEFIDIYKQLQIF